MSHQDECDPCSQDVEEEEDCWEGTLCNLDVTNNVWVEGVVDVPAGKRGICMLDSLTREQVVSILEHDPKARIDLPRVTSNPDLLKLLEEVPLLGTVVTKVATMNPRAGMPFYTVFQGNAPNAQFYPKRRP